MGGSSGRARERPDVGADRARRRSPRASTDFQDRRHARYNVVIADRFIVTAKADGIEFGALRNAVAALDLQKLEAMKDVGVVK